MIRVTTEITQSQPSNTVKSNFLDEAKLFWIKRISTGSPLRRAPLQQRGHVFWITDVAAICALMSRAAELNGFLSMKSICVAR
jgi:hypothetical protein